LEDPGTTIAKIFEQREREFLLSPVRVTMKTSTEEIEVGDLPVGRGRAGRPGAGRDARGVVRGRDLQGPHEGEDTSFASALAARAHLLHTDAQAAGGRPSGDGEGEI
jgi:hypothetical protein